MITEEVCVKACGRRNDERGVKRARDGDLPRRSVEILRDLGLSKDKIVAYHVAFRHPRPQLVQARSNWKATPIAVAKLDQLSRDKRELAAPDRASGGLTPPCVAWVSAFRRV